MPHHSSTGHTPANTVLRSCAALGLALASIWLAACGGSSSTSSTPSAANAAAATAASKSTPASTPASTSPAPTSTARSAPPAGGPPPTAAPSGPGTRHIAAVRECLRKDGVVLPQRGDSHGFIPGNNVKLPNGMTQAQFLQALKRCGGDRRPSGAGRLYSRNRFHAALASFAECLRRYGVHVPPLNNSGKGPLLNTKDLNANTPKFREASAKCRATLLAGLNGARKGAAGAAGGAAGVGASG